MPKPKPTHPPMKVSKLVNSKGKSIKRTKDFADVIRGKLANDPKLAAAVEKARVEAERECDEYAARPDTDDPRDMMPAEAACGPLTDPIIDEDEDDETPGFGETP